MRDFELSPRDLALYIRSNDYLTRMNALDPYSQEYANVYSDYVDTIDQLSDKEFRASLNGTLLDFAPLTRPRVQPRAPEPEVTPYGITVSSPNWKALPYTTAESQPRAANQQKGLSHMYADSSEPTSQGLALMQQVAPQTQEVIPDAPVEPQSRDKNYALSFINTTDGPFGPVVPFLQAARTYAQGDSSKEQTKEQVRAPTRWRPVYFGLDATGRTSPYAQALADISWDVWDGRI